MMTPVSASAQLHVTDGEWTTLDIDQGGVDPHRCTSSVGPGAFEVGVSGDVAGWPLTQ